MRLLEYFFIFIFICCLAFMSCDEAQMILEPPLSPENTLSQQTQGICIEIIPTEKGNPGHGLGTRSVYINGIGVAALKDDTFKIFPVGTLIIKEVNDNTNTLAHSIRPMLKGSNLGYIKKSKNEKSDF